MSSKNSVAKGLSKKPKESRKEEFLSYEEARKFVHKLKLEGAEDWRRYCGWGTKVKSLRPANIPSNPDITYRGSGWVNWMDWIGRNKKRQYWTFYKARAFVRKLGLGGIKEWNAYSKGEMRLKGKRPKEIPSNPSTVYRGNGWVDWADWLGKKKKR